MQAFPSIWQALCGIVKFFPNIEKFRIKVKPSLFKFDELFFKFNK